MEGEKCRLEAGPPAGPQPREPEPEDAVAATKSRATDGSLQHRQLMSEGDFLQADGGGTAEKSTEKRPGAEHEDHHGSQW
jgi:hypothetical protein